MYNKSLGLLMFCSGLFIGMSVFGLLFGSIIYNNGLLFGREEVRQEAIKHDAGYWGIDPAVGNTYFVWGAPIMAIPYDESANAASN